MWIKVFFNIRYQFVSILFGCPLSVWMLIRNVVFVLVSGLLPAPGISIEKYHDFYCLMNNPPHSPP